MIDPLTQSVLEYQQGKETLDAVRNVVLEEAYRHLERYRRKGEDEVSEFLLLFHGKVERLLNRFEFRNVPFRHFLLRTLKWQWGTFLAERSRRHRQDWLIADHLVSDVGAEEVAELPDIRSDVWKGINRRRLILLALKAAPYLNDGHLESISQESGVDLAWLQACQRRLRMATDGRRVRRERLAQRRGETLCRRLMAEDMARREVDPDRRREQESRADLYRTRLNRINRQHESISSAPTHRELANLLGMPKGSIDSGLYHLKKELDTVLRSPVGFPETTSSSTGTENPTGKGP